MSQVNINGTYLFGQKYLREMKDNERGHLMLIAPLFKCYTQMNGG